MYYRKNILYGAVLFILVLGSVVLYNNFYRTTKRIEPATAHAVAGSMRFEIATTTSAQERGLGGRINIPDNYGMLFVFTTSKKYGFWMKDMKVPIDIIWLSDKGVILGVEKSVSPKTYPYVFYPPKPVRYVLETRAGETIERGWSKGTIVQIPTL
ncbi:hypothetical protein MNBD_CPR01-263 [hydrothermal vent metagenome]|uniref:DUF192 domain-containing protein n=1 Tax=hydrothermal vent metagenome TaxID=652676 RepID=A0A3B0UXE3_9ZZZZ